MTKLTDKQKAELERLASLPDETINLDDLPEKLDWAQAQVGRFYKPVKRSVTIRIDADVLEWFKRHSDKYQSGINQALRAYIRSRQNG